MTSSPESLSLTSQLHSKISRFGIESKRPFAIFLTGPPGSGKTTQMQLLCEEFGSDFHVELFIGKQLRVESGVMGIQEKAFKFATSQPPEARERKLAAQLYQKNALGSCHCLKDHVEAYKNSTQQKPVFWIFSRGPTSKQQAKYLSEVLGIRPDLFIVLKLDEQEHLFDRVTYRRVDPVTNITYNLADDPPEDACVLARLESRPCDCQKSRLAQRFRTWKHRTYPVLEYYKQLNDPDIRVEFVNADRSREEVFRDICSLVYRKMKQKVYQQQYASSLSTPQLPPPHQPSETLQSEAQGQAQSQVTPKAKL